MATKKKKLIQLQCPHCKQQFTHIQYDARDRIPEYCSMACQIAAWRQEKQAATKDAPPAPPRVPIPRLHKVRPKDEARATGQSHGFAPKVRHVCYVWWDRQARAYRGTVRAIPSGDYAQWDEYRIWTEAAVITEVTSASIQGLVDLMRRYAYIDEYTQHKLLLDTPRSLRGQASPARIE